MRASDNHLYVTKFQNNSQHVRILANEYLGGTLGKLLGLPMAGVAIIDVSEWLIANSPGLKIETGTTSVPCASGLQLGSQYMTDPQQAQIFDYLPEAMLLKVVNREDFHRVLVFDKWTGNSDGRQAVFVKQRPKGHFYRASFIDHGHCFNAEEWAFTDAPLRGTFANYSVYRSVTGWKSFEPVLSQVEQLDMANLWKIANEVPKEWYGHDSDRMSRLIEELGERRSLIRDLINQFRKSYRNPFPSWRNG
jgi:hypothetical protein